jgi:hypothetical protein
LPQFTTIHLNSPQFTAIHRNSPQFAAICRNLPQFAAICRYSLLNCCKFCCATKQIIANWPQFAAFLHILPQFITKLPHFFGGAGLFFAGLTLAPPFIVVENNREPDMGGQPFHCPPPKKNLSGFFLVLVPAILL